MRGSIVRLTDAWGEILRRRAANTQTGGWPDPVAALLGEMAAAGVLLQSRIKFNGALVFQVFGDGPVKLAVAEVQSDLRLRATASVIGEVAPDAALPDLVQVGGGGRCAITLDPRDRQPGQQPYQGVVALQGEDGRPLQQMAQVLQQYMRQSEQLDATFVLAANADVAAGLMVQRMPVAGEANLQGQASGAGDGEDEDYQRIATLAASLTREELLSLDVDAILHRLFWQERLLRFMPRSGADGPRFACTCSRERVAQMLRTLGEDEVRSVLQERGEVEVGCEYCGQQYRFDAVDVPQLFAAASRQPPSSKAVQ